MRRLHLPIFLISVLSTALAQQPVDYREGLRLAGATDLAAPTAALACDDGFAYVMDGSELRIWNVSDPDGASPCGSCTIAGEVVDVAVHDGVVVAVQDAAVTVIDASDPDAPVQVGAAAIPGPGRRVAAADGLALVAMGAAGVAVVRVEATNPPTVLAQVDTPGSALDVALFAPWGVVADSLTLRAYDLAAPDAPSLIDAFAAPCPGYLPADPQYGIGPRFEEVVELDDGLASRTVQYTGGGWPPQFQQHDVLAAFTLTSGDTLGLEDFLPVEGVGNLQPWHGRLLAANGFAVLDHSPAAGFAIVGRNPHPSGLHALAGTGHVLVATDEGPRLNVYDAAHPVVVQPLVEPDGTMHGGWSFWSESTYDGPGGGITCNWEITSYWDPLDPVSAAGSSWGEEFASASIVLVRDARAMVSSGGNQGHGHTLFDHTGGMLTSDGLGLYNPGDAVLGGTRLYQSLDVELHVYDLHIPGEPALLGIVPLAGHPGYPITDDVLFRPSSDSDSWAIVDLSEISDPVDRGTIDLPADATIVGQEQSVVYFRTGHPVGGLLAVDCADLDEPTLTASMATPAPVLAWAGGDHWGGAGHAAVAYDGVGWQILDVADAHTIVPVSAVVPDPGSRDVAWSQHHVYVAAGAAGLLIYDVAEVAQPAYVGRSVAADYVDVGPGVVFTSSGVMPQQVTSLDQPVSLLEDFDDGVADGFEVVSGAWEVIGGEYHCFNAESGVKHISTVGSLGWRDYRVDVDLRAAGAPIQELMVRYRDEENWYLVNVLPDPHNRAELWKCEDGQQSLLVRETGIVNDPETWHHVTVEVLGPTIRAVFDGQEVLRYTDIDAPFLSGKVALDAFADPSVGWHHARFDNVAIEPLPSATSATETPSAEPALTAYPNPFNPRTSIRFGLPRAGPVTLRIYDVRGRLVRTLLDAEMAGGEHEIVWKGRDDDGRAVASGVYVGRLQTADGRSTRKMCVVR